MRCDVLGLQGWLLTAGRLGVVADQSLDGVRAEAAAKTTGEEEVARLATVFAEPGPEDGDALPGERGDAFPYGPCRSSAGGGRCRGGCPEFEDRSVRISEDRSGWRAGAGYGHDGRP